MRSVVFVLIALLTSQICHAENTHPVTTDVEEASEWLLNGTHDFFYVTKFESNLDSFWSIPDALWRKFYKYRSIEINEDLTVFYDSSKFTELELYAALEDEGIDVSRLRAEYDAA